MQCRQSCNLCSAANCSPIPSSNSAKTAYRKSSPYSIAERRFPELIPVLGSQLAGNVSHKPGSRLPLLSTRPAVTLATLKRAARYCSVPQHPTSTNYYCYCQHSFQNRTADFQKDLLPISRVTFTTFSILTAHHDHSGPLAITCLKFHV